MRRVFGLAAAIAGLAGSAAAEQASLSTPMLIEASNAPAVLLDDGGFGLGAVSLVIYAIAGLAFAMRQGKSSS